MNRIRKWIRDVFGFSGNEINGFLVLIPLMIILIFSEPVYHYVTANQERQYPDDIRKLDSLLAIWPPSPTAPSEELPVAERAFFDFDPNTASIGELRNLGLSAVLANRIAAYRRKGGAFVVKSDLLKIYGLDSTLYNQLYTYIKLPSGDSDQQRRNGLKIKEIGTRKTRQKKFDINLADTTTLKKVYGIGSTLAARIIRFRDALGGFVRPQQLYEVYGLDSIVVERLLEISIIDPGFIPEKININTADEKTLSGHPYIRRKIAVTLLSYRFQHGDFVDVNDIRKLSIMQPDEVERLLPYLKVND